MRFSRLCRSVIAIAATLGILLSFSPGAAAAPVSALEITKYSTWWASSNNSTFKYAVDGNLRTFWTSTAGPSRYLDITVRTTTKTRAGSIYFRWNSPPASWELLAKNKSGGYTSILKGGAQRYLTQFVSIPSAYAGVNKYRLVMNTAASAAVSIAELSVYAVGTAPYFAPQWKDFPANGRVDLLTIASHPDDEALYLGVPAVTYAAQGKTTATVFMTYGSPSTSLRRFEAQECAWALGNTYYPAMANFKDVKTSTKDAMARVWGLDKTVAFLVEQIRKFKPSVIVTHDIMGEYWHGAHQLTEYATSLAFRYAGDPKKYPESAMRYGTWNAGKLYVHLYKTNALNTMSLTAPLSRFGGRTALQTIGDAYARHKSQLPGRVLPISGAYDMRKFGLLATNVGLDKTRSNMFENITMDKMLRLNPQHKLAVANSPR